MPAYSSNPGAAYTVYLDFGGFTFGGNWNGDGNPGTTPAYDSDGDATTFSATELADIKTVWANVSGKYAGYSINVTTVDPAGGMTDPQRQAYYDNTAQLMHTVIGGKGAWESGIAGVSQLGTTRNSYGNPTTNNGAHTNWIFAGQDPSYLPFVAGGTTHENGHGFGLYHQSNVTNPASPIEYDPGDPAGPTNGNGSVSPIMGGQDDQTRNNWRVGTKDDGTIQNDVASILGNPNMTLTADGVGHSFGTATPLSLIGSTVNAALSKGYINSASATNPNPIGVDNYTKDYFSFNTNGTPIDLTLHAGGERATAGVADAGATFDGSFDLYTSAGMLVGQSTRDPSTVSYAFDGILAAGSYYAEVLDYGGYTSPTEPATGYFTSGDYFFTGDGGFVAAPEPTSLALVGVGAIGLLGRRRRPV